MIWSDYWGALSARQRIGLSGGFGLILVATVALAVWLLRDPMVPLAADLNAERMNALTQELDRAKIGYQIGDGGDAVSVPQSQLGRARAAAASGQFGVPASVGLELFKDNDFSGTDFAQRINYQRALQGELTRTIQSVAGVRSARVHVILPDAGLFKRNAAKASAAVSLAMHPGKLLTRSQVRGLQRLVAASVPEIRIDDVVVLDESGASLTRAAGDVEGDMSSAQLDLKRQADEYLEGKLTRLLEEIVPHGTASLSVDTELDYKQLRITTEEPIASQGPKGEDRAAGVLVKERQSQRGRAAGPQQAAGDAAEADSTDWEYEYKVGHRMEQTLSTPGSIKRVSVAVALQGAPADLSSAAVEDLVAHAVGINRARGDSVAVLLLAGPKPEAAMSVTRHAVVRDEHRLLPPAMQDLSTPPLLAVLLAAAAALAGVLLWRRQRVRPPINDQALVDVEATTVQVRQWLGEGGRRHGRD